MTNIEYVSDFDLTKDGFACELWDIYCENCVENERH